MKTISWGEALPNQGNAYLRVKQKGDQITFRIAQNPVYSGKHFMQKEDGWDVTNCPRVNNGEECDSCNMFFKGLAESKKFKGVDEAQAKAAEKEARKFKVAISFYFPVLNRDTGKFGILQVTAGVRNKLNTQHEAGIKIMDKDWILRNTGSANPGDIYMIAPLDSADVKPLTKEEVAEFEKASKFDLSTLNDGGNSSDEIEE